MKKDKSGKMAINTRKVNKVTMKRKAQFCNMEKLISRKSRKISEGTDGKFWATTFDFDYAYLQIKWDENTTNLCLISVTARDVTGYNIVLYGLADVPTILQEQIDTTHEHKHPA